MPFPFLVKAIKHAVERHNENRAYQQWLSVYPHMTKETFVPFSEFLEQSKQQIDRRSTQEMLAEFEQISALMRGEG